MIHCKNIISQEGQIFQLPSQHPLFSIGIFQLINENDPVPIPSKHLAYMIYDIYKTFDFESILPHLQWVFQFCFKSHEKKCLYTLFKLLKNKGLISDTMLYFFQTSFIREIIQSVPENIDIIKFSHLCLRSFNMHDLSQPKYKRMTYFNHLIPSKENKNEKIVKYTGFSFKTIVEQQKILNEDTFQYMLDHVYLFYNTSDSLHSVYIRSFFQCGLTKNMKKLLKKINFMNPVGLGYSFYKIVLGYATTELLEWIIDHCKQFHLECVDEYNKSLLDLSFSLFTEDNNTCYFFSANIKNVIGLYNIKLLVQKGANVDGFLERILRFLKCNPSYLDIDSNFRVPMLDLIQCVINRSKYFDMSYFNESFEHYDVLLTLDWKK